MQGTEPALSKIEGPGNDWFKLSHCRRNLQMDVQGEVMYKFASDPDCPC